jgi:hypothetical protein
MLINEGNLIPAMPMRDALQLGLEATEKQVQQAIKYLKSEDPECVHWNDFEFDRYSSIMKHREYSGPIIDGLDCLESNELLVLILGDNGNSVFDEALNFPSKINRTIEAELSSLIGSDIVSRYSKTQKSSGFEKDSISVRVKFVTNPEHLEDIDLEGYMALVLLESSATKFCSEVVDWLKESETTLPIIYNFSEGIAQETAGLSEIESSSIAASWVFAVGELNPIDQMEYLLHAMNQLFIESDYDNTNSHVRSIINEQYIHQKRNKSKSEALFSASKLSSSGHNYFRRFIEKTITLHSKAIKKVRSLILPDSFQRELNSRVARDNWFDEIISVLCTKMEEDGVLSATRSMIGLHTYFDDVSEWRGNNSDESEFEKLQRWSNNIPQPKRGDLNRIFREQGKGRNLYGGSKGYQEKNNFAENAMWNGFEHETTLVKNLHPRFWSFFRSLFAITNASKYDIEAENPPLLPIHKSRMNISEISKIRKAVCNNLLNELFLDFTIDGGVLQ